MSFNDAITLAPHAHSVEIYKHGCAVDCDRPDGTHMLDLLLSDGLKLNAIATDDAHFKTKDYFGGWVNVNDPIEIPQTTCGANADWNEMSVTYEVTEVDDYRVQIYKNGANGLAASLHMDSFSFVYTEAAAVTVPVTFNVNMASFIGDFTTVHVNGEFTGWCGSCGNEATDPDGDGIYSITMDLEPGSYFWKYTVDGWGGQEGFDSAVDGCTAANGDNFDRQIVVEEGSDPIEVTYCWNSCESTACEPPTTTQVTFNVNMNAYGLADGQTVHVNGEFTGWCGSCGNEATDPDGDGIYSITMELEHGSYFWKYTVDAWNDQEGFSSAQDGCTAQNGGAFDRQIVVEGETMEVTYCWNTCADYGCYPLRLQGIMDFETPAEGSGGKGTHLYAEADIADLSAYSVSMYNNGSDTAGNTVVLSGSASAGDHILVYRDLDALNAYMGASDLYQIFIDGSVDEVPNGNGDDTVALLLNGEVVDRYGDIGVDGDDGWSDANIYDDTWGYRNALSVWYWAPTNSSDNTETCLLYTSPSPRDRQKSSMPSSA